MKIIFRQVLPKCLLASLVIAACAKNEDQGPPPDSFGIDHTCSVLSEIPESWIDAAKAISMHYAHTSHGEQVTIGLERIETGDPEYDVEIAYSTLPPDSGALRIFDGQETETYITPELYWQTPEGMNLTRDVLNNNPGISVSMWMWCTQLDYYSTEEVQAYLDSMTVLEAEFPAVTFIYATGNAQATGAEGYNRHQRNQQIRDYCEQHDKMLFDFADLDCWWFNAGTDAWEYETYSHEGVSVPVEHSRFHGDEAGHTTYESCEQKGRACWWLLARIAGWSGS